MPKSHKIGKLYYGKLQTWAEVKELKESVIRRYKHSTKKNISSIHRDLLKEGYDIPYDTIRTWTRRSGVKIVRPDSYVTPEVERIPESFSISQEVSGVINAFGGIMKRADLVDSALRMFMGMPMTNVVILFFDQGNVIITEKDNQLHAVTTQTLKPGDLKLLQGMVNMAEENLDWESFVKQYAKSSGIPYYPMY
jgi:hypothetical protein